MFQIDDNGEVSAPLSGSQIKEMAAGGKLFDDMRIKKLPDGPWQSVGVIKGVSLAERPLASPPAPSTLKASPRRTATTTPPPKVKMPAAPRPRPLPMQPTASTAQTALVPSPARSVPQATVEEPASEVIDVEYTQKSAQLIECPFCSEDIKPTAKKCKHCGEILDVVMRDAQRAPAAQAPQQAAPTVVVNNSNVVSANAHAYAVYRQPTFSPLVAALLSFLIPGLGQLYKGQPINGMVWFVVVIGGYVAFILPGVVLHFCCIIGAASGSHRGGRGW